MSTIDGSAAQPAGDSEVKDLAQETARATADLAWMSAELTGLVSTFRY